MDCSVSAEDSRKERQAQRLQDKLTPTGFRFMSNISVNAEKMIVNESWIPGEERREEVAFIEYIARIRNKYGDLQLTEAYSRSGELLGSPWNLWYAVYVPL